MSPEYGATCGFFPVDDETLRYLRMTGRDEQRLALVEAYCKENLLWHDPDDHPVYTQVVDLDLSTVEPSIAGPRRPQDRVPLAGAKEAFVEALGSFGVDYANGSYDKEGRGQLPGERPARPATRRTRARRSRPAPPPPATVSGHRRERRELRALARRGRDRRDHVLHEHLEPERDDRRRAAREEGGRARAHEPPVGEDLARARLEGRHRVLRAGRPDRLPRGARLPHRRLRLHDLHRELRAAARGGLARGRRQRPRRLRRALREPELRGAHPSRGEGELPRLAAARRRLRARRADGRRPRRPSRSRTTRTASRSTCATSGRPPRRSPTRSPRRCAARCSAAPTPTSTPATRRWRALDTPEGDLFAWEPDSTYVRLPPYFDGMSPRAGHGRRRLGRALPRDGRRLGHDRPHLARRLDQARLARRRATSSSTASSAPTSTRTARDAATTR